MNQLNRMATDTVNVRFDLTLQSIKTTLSACRNFLQCSSCQKDSANLLLSVSIVDLTLQLVDHQINHNESPHKSVSNSNIRYGQYDLEHEENRRINNFLIHSLLLECRDILGLLKETLDLCIGPQKLVSPVVDSYSFESNDASSSLWMQFHPGHVSAGVDGNCLHHVLMGHEATVESLLRAVSLRECICN